MPLPMEKQASWGLQHHGQAGMARSDSTKAWLHQSMGAGLGMGMGVLQGRAWPLQCHGGWEGGREGEPGWISPIPLLQPLQGSLLKAHVGETTRTMWLK